MFSGAMTAIVTPFNNGEVNYEELEKVIEFNLNKGISGIVPCGSTGESATLSTEEHEKVVEFVVKKVNKKVPVIAGTGSNSTQEAIELTIGAEKAGADAALVITPYYNKPTQEGMYRHFKMVAEKVKIPIILYNVPGRTGINLLPDTVVRLSEIKNIVGIKEASGSLDQVSSIINRAKDFIVLSGDDSLTLPMLSIGGNGVISTTANIVPKEMDDMVKAYLAGDTAKAMELHYFLFDICKVMFIETNPIPVKQALEFMGICSAELRMPLCEMNDKNKDTLKKVLKEKGLI